MKPTWDIFCSVVDNYGVIGVTWRLARQLVAEHGQAVRLWVDELAAFCRLCPEASSDLTRQWHHGVEVCQWSKTWQAQTPADVVIEAFGCQLPADYISAMTRKPTSVLWLNLEYLSAEEWVDGCHGLPSLQVNGVQKFFFFPGFTGKTGGLLREAGLLDQRNRFQQDPLSRRHFLRRLGVAPQPDARLISLFAYENAGLAEWLQVLAAGPQLTHLLVPEGRILGDLQRWLNLSELVVGAVEVRGCLTVQILPFSSQDDYDRLLWSCDFNAVRGEDSFVRGQWAGRSLLWHIYPQQENAHWDKLESFLLFYTAALSPEAQVAVSRLWRAWNAGEGMAEGWLALQPVWDEVLGHGERWAAQQSGSPDLATALVQFYLNWI